MHCCFFTDKHSVFLVESKIQFNSDRIETLSWMFQAEFSEQSELGGSFLGPRKEMITPWSTCAVEIAENMGVSGIHRIEKFVPVGEGSQIDCDPMTQFVYQGLRLNTLGVDYPPQALCSIDDIAQSVSYTHLTLPTTPYV